MEQAQREFEDVLRADPNNANAHRGLGYAALRAGKLDTAAREFHWAASLNSQDPRVHYYSALLMQRQNRARNGKGRTSALMAYKLLKDKYFRLEARGSLITEL